jgi:hypothetical protein
MLGFCLGATIGIIYEIRSEYTSTDDTNFILGLLSTGPN